MMKERRYPLVDTIKTLQKQVLQEINTIQSPSRRPYAEVIIKGIKIPFLYDTGADVSCIKGEIFKQLKN